MRIVITGANSGIGRAAALHLARAGHEVVGTTRSLERAGKLIDAAESEGLPVTVVTMDVADPDSVATGFEQVLADGPVDVLVNNAGIGSNATLEDASEEEWYRVYETNVFGPVRCTRAVLPHMRERGSGHICMVSSVVGRLAAVGQAVYTSSKWAMEGYSEVLALEVARFGIRVTVVEPGVTRTAILAKNTAWPEGAHGESYRRMFAMYATLIPEAPGPELTARVIADALDDQTGRFRWRSGDDAEKMLSGRAAMTDEEFLALGDPDDATFIRIWKDRFSIDLTPGMG